MEKLKIIPYIVLAMLLLLLEALVMIFSVPYFLWQKVVSTANWLKAPPPNGGMYGTMARHFREKEKL